MLFIKSERIDYEKINVKTVKVYIDGDPNPKTLQEIQAHLNKTIRVDIGIKGIYKANELLMGNLVEIKKGA